MDKSVTWVAVILLAFFGILMAASGMTFILDYFFGIIAVVALLRGWPFDNKSNKQVNSGDTTGKKL